MALIDMIMPKMGESIMECTVITWLKQPGDRIEADESVLEVATDKVDTEVPAPFAGVLKELLVKDGDVVAIGAPIARIEVAKESAEQATAPSNDQPDDSYETPKGIGDVANPELATSQPEAESHDVTEVARELEASISAMSSRPAVPETGTASSKHVLPNDGPIFANRFYSPLVLNIAKEESVSRDELDRIPGSGADNRLTKKDILAYVIDRAEGKVHETWSTAQKGKDLGKFVATGSTPPVPSTQPTAPRSLNGQTDIIQMDRMRKMIAQRMVESKQISPHVSSFVEADMTPVVEWRTKVKDQFKQQTGENLTYTPILVEAVVKAIKDFPMINISVEGDTILVKKQVNIGMAVALPNGNLIVPVIHNADQYNLVGLTKKVNDLTKRARENKLTADDLAGGTYTISNIGTFGNLMGTPIIVQPQVAIMAFGAIVKKPAVIETPQGDFIGIRQLMFLSHSYDHRVVDGSLGGQFVRRVADYLEQFKPGFM
ncbi:MULTISPECIES: dihydrolipoamide acetyltransferase family protein [unclassified Spirosoma]|uniref:dihydrolipoamide acetyltransferase family protein n=1 Tax=unclassified Spirosoma TaxID=2621999 RepID=UPI000960454C|nr:MULTISPECIES: dihydrolipoamide acetyltransferase family protein [unclassified Spirosoma]MBN8821110.1 2-oxo acid dehydrogenase subunit E2 [Spirosoma sp.]OJW79253.1 MAG: diapophytoene dehydrogenase [Spirosoma sp. 48-14]